MGRCIDNMCAVSATSAHEGCDVSPKPHFGKLHGGPAGGIILRGIPSEQARKLCMGKMMKLTKAEVEHVALLARLELTEDESERMTERLNQIMVHFEKLQELDTEDVIPTSHSIPVLNVFREDKAGRSLKPEEALAAAPEAENDYFVVPQVVET